MQGANNEVINIIGRVPRAQPPEDVDALIRTLLQIPDNDDITDDHYTADIAEAVAQMVDYLCSKSTGRTRAVGVNQYTCTYIAVGKRGTVSTNKLPSINQAVSLETNLEVNVTEEQVKALGTALANYIDETNAAQVMEALRNNMTDFSLRLRLTVQQTLRSGMTQYWAILEAFNRFQTFGWGEASRFIPDDFTKFRVAMGLVQGNQYYGFRKDLGNAAHTHYKSLGWLAVKLLIKWKGAEFGSLQQYRGLARNPDRQQELQDLIDEYVPPADDVPVAHLDDILTDARALINNVANV